MPVTIRDVAKAANVSPMAVSKALHGKGANVGVSVETAEHIRRIAKELGYRPNELARRFRRQQTLVIGVVFERFLRITGRSLYPAMLLDGILQTAFESGYTVALCASLNDPRTTETFGDGRFDGLLWAKFSNDERSRRLANECPVPLVLIHTPELSIPDVPNFCCDNVQAVRLGVEYLKNKGHRRIAFIRDASPVFSEDGFRAEAFLAASKEFGLPIDESDILQWSEDAHEMGDWLATKPDHTAIFLWSEYMAGGVIAQAKRHGLRIPEDFSVLGFDSSDYCEQLRPRLTAINQPIEQIAADATRALIQMLDGKKVRSAPLYPCTLDERESVGAPRAARLLCA